MFTRIDRYMGRLMIVPMVATLTISAMLLLLERMLNLFNFVINEGGPVSVVWRMLANLMPEQFGFALPISLLLGVMMAVRTLALNSELDALLGSGVSHARLLRAPLAMAGVLVLLTVWLVGYEQPYSRYAYERLRFELQSGALGASIKVGEFAKLGENIVLRVDGSEDGGQKLSRVFLRAEEKEYGTVVASAEHATFLATDNPDVLLLRLFKGKLVQDKPGQAAPSVLSFSLHDIPINLPHLEHSGPGAGSWNSRFQNCGAQAKTPADRRSCSGRRRVRCTGGWRRWRCCCPCRFLGWRWRCRPNVAQRRWVFSSASFSCCCSTSSTRRERRPCNWARPRRGSPSGCRSRGSAPCRSGPIWY